MIWVYRRAASEGANLLAEDILLKGVRARKSQGRLMQERIAAGDFVICWGERYPAQVPNGVKVLNNVAPVSKFEEAQILARAGVTTVQVSRTRPAARARAPFEERVIDLRAITRNTARDEAQRLIEFADLENRRYAEWQRQPAVVDEWLPRRNNHVGGSDLLRAPVAPDYYSKKENIVEEYRLHMFNGKSIRAGIKRQRQQAPNGQPSHPWIRSFDAGWVIAYEGFRSTAPMRELAAKAVKALGLDFGAVDMGKLTDGSFIVLEVNRAPGVENNTSVAYADAIIKWTRGGE